MICGGRQPTGGDARNVPRLVERRQNEKAKPILVLRCILAFIHETEEWGLRHRRDVAVDFGRPSEALTGEGAIYSRGASLRRPGLVGVAMRGGRSDRAGYQHVHHVRRRCLDFLEGAPRTPRSDRSFSARPIPAGNRGRGPFVVSGLGQSSVPVSIADR